MKSRKSLPKLKKAGLLTCHVSLVSPTEFGCKHLTPVPGGGGFIHFPTGHGNKDDSDDIYVVSVFHQLHCLVSQVRRWLFPQESKKA
jgi:hypothetical protein